VTRQRPVHKPVLALTLQRDGFYIAVVKLRNQLLALFCLAVFFAFGVFYFRYWVVQKPFGIILFVGEGLSADRLAVTRIYAGGADKPLTMDSLTYSALLRNFSANAVIPDDAAAATALATGKKVTNGAIGIDSKGRALKNLVELARESGRMTGLVTNARLTNPTLASFYAHASTKSDRQSLARELVEAGNVDLVLGGGAQDFLPVEQGGIRADSRDLLTEIQNAGYELVRTREELDEIPRWRQAKLFGVFSNTELDFAAPTNEEPSQQPTLADMVRRGIELLQFNSGGYLLIVDGGLMRRAAEAQNAQQTLVETVEMDRAIAVALEYAGVKSTILVCGDVAQSALVLTGDPPRNLQGTAILESDADGKPWLSWLPPAAADAADAADAERPDSEGIAKADDAEVAPSPADAESGPKTLMKTDRNVVSDMPAFGTGLGADALHGSAESTIIFEIIRDNL
jgi:alkaline phosphatase